MSGWKQRIVLLACLGCALFLVFHFVAVFLAVAPWNPIYAMSAPVVDGYVNPYFRQNWELFAPDPIDYNSHVLVRAKIRDSEGRERQTDWLDISAPELARVRGTAFPGRIARLVGGGRQLMTDADVQPLTTDAAADASSQSAEAEAEADDGAVRRPPDSALQSQAVRHMAAIATLAARARWGDGVTAVQVRVTTAVFPRFADRHNADDDTSQADFGWWEPAHVTTDAIGLWREAHR